MSYLAQLDEILATPAPFPAMLPQPARPSKRASGKAGASGSSSPPVPKRLRTDAGRFGLLPNDLFGAILRHAGLKASMILRAASRETNDRIEGCGPLVADGRGMTLNLDKMLEDGAPLERVAELVQMALAGARRATLRLRGRVLCEPTRTAVVVLLECAMRAAKVEELSVELEPLALRWSDEGPGRIQPDYLGMAARLANVVAVRVDDLGAPGARIAAEREAAAMEAGLRAGGGPLGSLSLLSTAGVRLHVEPGARGCREPMDWPGAVPLPRLDVSWGLMELHTPCEALSLFGHRSYAVDELVVGGTGLAPVVDGPVDSAISSFVRYHQVKRLTLQYDRSGPSPLRLAEVAEGAKLEELRLFGSASLDMGVARLPASGPATLRVLAMRDCWIRQRDVGSMVAAHAATLEELEIMLADEGQLAGAVHALASGAGAPRLRRLDLVGTRLPIDGRAPGIEEVEEAVPAMGGMVLPELRSARLPFFVWGSDRGTMAGAAAALFRQPKLEELELVLSSGPLLRPGVLGGLERLLAALPDPASRAYTVRVASSTRTLELVSEGRRGPWSASAVLALITLDQERTKVVAGEPLDAEGFVRESVRLARERVERGGW